MNKPLVRKGLHASIFSAQRISLSAQIVRVEVDISTGLRSFSIIGLPDKAVGEARERVSAAIKHTGIVSPKQQNQKVIVSLAPSDLPKIGALFDVPIALTYLLANGAVSFDPKGKMFVGELSLNGNIRHARGILPLICCAKESGFQEVYVPASNAEEAALVDGISVIPCASLADILGHLQKKTQIDAVSSSYTPRQNKGSVHGFESVRGQESVKRALTVAGAGGHNVALYGPPGTGKTLLAKSLTTILPPLSRESCIEVTALHSIGRTETLSPIHTPPFRNPHHTSSHTSIVGGGTLIRPGEISLAHRGVLFLDEFPEFDRRTIESLREPLEEHSVTITRSSGSSCFPASCIVVVAFNLCPCGSTGTDAVCSCSASARATYHRKITGPIADRIDVWVSVEAVEFDELIGSQTDNGQNSSGARTAKEQVLSARERQRARYADTSITLNSEIEAGDVERHIPLSPESKVALQQSADGLSLSPRGYHRTIKCARTIADIANEEVVLPEHIFEAVGYRSPPEI